MTSPLLKAIGVGAGVFIIMMLVFFAISYFSGVPFLELPQFPASTPTPTPDGTLPPFLRQ